MTRDRANTSLNIGLKEFDSSHKPTAARGFVINLCALAAPITVPQPRASSLTRYSFFLSRCSTNVQRQYQLQMGYFASITEAEKWLVTLKRVYPGAFVSTACEAQMDVLSSTAELRILNVGRIGEATDSRPAIQQSQNVGNAGVADNTIARKERAAMSSPPATRELFARDAPAGRKGPPSLEDTLEELRTSEFDMGGEDDSNTTGVRHLRIDVLRDRSGTQSPQRTDPRARK